MKQALHVAFAIYLCLLQACAQVPVEPQPLPPAAPLAAPLADVAATQNIDLSLPLSADALAAIAVYSNPDLNALRVAQGVAEAQVFAAGLFPDPTFTFGLDAPLNGDKVSSALFLGLGMDFAALAGRPAAMRGAQANLESVRFDIAWSEWLTGEQARLLALRIAYLRQIRALTAQLRTLADAEVEHSLHAAVRGDVPESALQGRRLAAADAADRDRSAQLQLRTAELELNRLLGIAPQEQLQLAAPPQPTEQLLSLQALYQLAVSTRTDLMALRAAYEGSQAAVDAAQLGRYPLPTLDINAARDTSRIKTLGPGITFTLPLESRARGCRHRHCGAGAAARRIPGPTGNHPRGPCRCSGGT
ncbi:MAG: hypothetical protein R3E64_04290 [Halioglobus sp.]